MSLRATSSSATNCPLATSSAAKVLPSLSQVKSKVEQSFKAVLAEKYCTGKGERINLSHLPLFCFPDGIKIAREIRGFATFNFIFTLADAEQVFVTCLIFKENLSEKQRERL